ncbi:carbamoyl-phosphate synthase large subunit [Burkholderiaceae bacterium FT117]|uniref:acetyl-CoA carboxylase family protein n=1 Tax=Zeimonas sediminis TaxID=2944268 RepID=UPI002342C1E3|nr:carboxyl transferase domain-containing protein [Zeimonas sediminis]MCM5571627.1 carbamoyl-phosphate synthase large subunit [Zeimonas sediminis]
MNKLLIANRGEIALRILRAARDLGIATVAVHSRDDAALPHLALADDCVPLDATGAAAYLDIEAIVAAGLRAGCDAVHPGYGFLSERPEFAAACAKAGLVFVGPTVAQLELFGDKAIAIDHARQCGVPVMPSTRGGATLAEIEEFYDAHGCSVDAQLGGEAPPSVTAGAGRGIVIKAVGGGGGRGMRAVTSRDALAEAFARCTSEARAAFGVADVYAERLIARARHIEVQVVGDGREVVALGERDCTLQRRFQKLVEVAPSPALAPALRERIVEAALVMAREAGYRGLGTFEFLVDEGDAPDLPFVFIEANPRLQVEHTITEAVTGVDLVAVQLRIAAGASLREAGLDPLRPPKPQGFAIQFRINAESLDAQGLARPASGRLDRFDLPAGPGVRVDTHGRPGYAPSPHYDTLLAKLVVSSPGEFAQAVRRGQRALRETRIEGIATNLWLLRALAEREEFATQAVHTRHFEAILGPLLARAAELEAEGAELAARAAAGDAQAGLDAAAPGGAPGGAHPPLPPPHAGPAEALPEGLAAIRAPMAGRLAELSVAAGDLVRAGQTVAVLEAMKMEHTVTAGTAGRVVEARAAAGDQVAEAQALVLVEPLELDEAGGEAGGGTDPRAIRADLRRILDRHAFTLDAARTEAVAKRHARGLRTARENIADLCDEGSFVEYGALTVAAQSRRRSMDDLVANTPGDGMVTGIGSVNRERFGAERSRCVVMAYDFTVLAGTQGFRNHAKTDRMLELAARQRLPVVLFAEGGGGRPGDVDMPVVAGLDLTTFASFAALSGRVPVVGIVAGRCFAGNAALVGCADVIVATRDSNLGMGGPAMIEGGGLGVFRPEEIGPSSVQHANGVIDILVDDEAQAVAAAKHYLSMFQGRTDAWRSPDPELLRGVVPENRLRVYDTRAAIEGLVDTGSLLWLRTGFGAGIHTALARIAGRPVGLLANNPFHLSGAIDADAADKAARFMQLCDAHGLPIVSLIDTPGFMVGPEIETRAQVRHVSRMFVAAAKLRVPFFAVVLRKGYGLGAMAMAAGGFHAPAFTVSWPTGEFGGMGLEGAVRLGFRKELEAAPEGPERDALYRELVARQYEKGSAINTAVHLEIDAVIDPASTRDWLFRGLESAALAPLREAGRFVDTW